MTTELAMNLWMLVCSFFGTVYGFRIVFKKNKALYLKMINFGVACFMLSKLFNVIILVTNGELYKGFNIGILGIVGSFLFFLSANYGQMDGLVDDRSSTFRLTRIKALIMPAVILIGYVFLFLNIQNITSRISTAFLILFILPCLYFNFKHIIIYDVDLGIIKQLKFYNILAVIYAFLTVAQLYGTYMMITPVYVGASICSGLVIALIMPVVIGGAKKWTL